MKLTKSNPKRIESGIRGKGWKTSYYLNDVFIMNLCVHDQEPHMHSSKRSRLAQVLLSFKTSGGQFLKFRAPRHSSPDELINWIEESGYTVDSESSVNRIFEESYSRDYVDFSGRVVEWSYTFHFRVFNSSLVEHIKERITPLLSPPRLSA